MDNGAMTHAANETFNGPVTTGVATSRPSCSREDESDSERQVRTNSRPPSFYCKVSDGSEVKLADEPSFLKPS